MSTASPLPGPVPGGLPAQPTAIDRRFLKRLPPFAPIAVQLLAVMADERKSFKEIARLISFDPVMAAEVLRLANSGLYGRRFEVRSVMQAIALLGIGCISQMVVTAALWRGLPRRTSPFVAGWWRHSIASALIAQQCNKDIPSDHAYTAALLHGVGQLALFEDSPAEYPALVQQIYADGADLLGRERTVFGVDHATLAGLMLEAWGLPETMCVAAWLHHEERPDPHPTTTLGLAVRTGCAGAEHAGFGHCGCHIRLVEGVPEPVTQLFTGDYPLAALIAEVNQIECSLL